MKKVCFVCLGNICRSPMAEFVMKDLDKEGKLEVASRATSDWEHGNPIHRGTQAIFSEYAIDYDSHKTSQKISQEDFAYFDVIVGMDEQNVADLLGMSNGRFDDKIVLFRSGGVPDPWYTGDFEETYDLVKEGCASWLAKWAD
ncbi:low molecular weight protein-tyrosine-phosphatase [Streptococcus sp. zg-JUN1979]|uniref:low molecular weight protein-tyrosine-phosphatase n=1 Tax=Streptococcus sp. zg-JUN1979 TaxID=3391450 RepID=UPI0039A51D48